MTAPWLRRRSKTEERERLVALCAVGLHFVVAVVLGFAVVYSDEWLANCFVLACGDEAMGFAIYGFLIFDIVLFFAAWALTFVLASKGWWRIAPPLMGTVLTVLAGAFALFRVLVGSA